MVAMAFFPVGLKKTHYRDHTESHTERKQPMNDNILRFPGFILLEDRNTVLKDGKRYKSMKALIDEDLKLTYQWRIRRQLRLKGLPRPRRRIFVRRAF
jgi:hypothetical protein